MAYRIDYCKGTAQKTEVSNGKAKKNVTAAIIIVSVAILGFLTFSSIDRSRLYEILIPGDPVITETAAIRFAEDIQHGKTIIDAFGGFCKEVINGAKIPGIY